MTETLPADVTAENLSVNDQQVDKYFESGGEEAPAQEQEGEKPAESEPVEQQPKIEKVVPYGALHEEREKRKELQRQIQENAEKTRRMEEAFQRIQQNLQRPQQEAPSYEDNPLEALKHVSQSQERQLAEMRAHLQQKYEAEQFQQRDAQFINRYQQSALAYLKEQPDFTNAYNFLVQSRIQEYQAAGYSRDEVTRLITDDERAIAAKAFNEGANPAERMWNLAVARGYRKSAPVNSENATNKLRQVEQGVQQSKSLSGAQGQSSSETLSLEKLAAIEDQAEFDKAWNKLIAGNKGF